MKLHFNKNWVRQFDHTSTEPEIIVGENSNVDSAIALLGKKELLNNWKEFPINEIVERNWININVLN